MGRRASKRVAYVATSYALVPYSFDRPDLLVRVSRSVVFFSCQRCGAPAGVLCIRPSGELMTSGHRRQGKRFKKVDVAKACLELVTSGRFHELHVLGERVVVKDDRQKGKTRT